MIYLYPEDTTTVHVSLEFQGELKYTYPDYRDGWKVTACPDGTLFDGNGRSYYGLFWEGPSENPLEATDGFVIASDSIVSFLEEKLYQLGLTDKEANEFIVFWYPILSESPYNHIQFATTTYENQAKLNVAPHPETVIRVMMVYEPLDAMKEVPLQLLPPRPKRNGFTLVEWGGTRSVPRGM
jgi:hypothetical protein